MIYQNFDLEIISPQGGQLCARVLESPQGDCPFMSVHWPFDAAEESALLDDIYGGLRQRRARAGKGGTIQDFGGKLFDAVFSGDIEHLFRASLDTAARAGKGLRIRLRLPEDSELHARPWEFLFDTECGEFLAVRENTPLIRYLPVAQPIPPISVEGPLRVLVALSSPTDHPRLDIAREWEILCQALEPSITAGRLELRRVPGNCTFDNLRDSLRHFSTHIFHFVGHGMPGALVLEQESGRGHEMEATHLRAAFPSGALPRLIVLNACSGAISEDAPFSGLAQGFLKQGVPAVVAMQASITDNAALIFTRYFYRDLIETGAVDASLTEARLRMQGNGHPIEWGTPVLYMRALSGQLFQPSASPAEEKKPFELPLPAMASAPPPRIEPSLTERKKTKESLPKPGTPQAPPVQPAPNPTEKRRPRTVRNRGNQPPVESGQNLQHAAMPAALPREPAAAPEPPLKPAPRPAEQQAPPKTLPKTPAPPPPSLPLPQPKPAPQLAEPPAPAKSPARKQAPAQKLEPKLEPRLEPKLEPELEPKLNEPAPAAKVPVVETVPVGKPAAAPEPQSRPPPIPEVKNMPPAKAKSAYNRWLLIYAMGGALLAAILALAIGIEKPTPTPIDTTSAAIPAPAASAPAVAPAPAAAPPPSTASTSAAATPAPPVQPSPALANTKAAASAPAETHSKRKPQPKAKAPPRADNCRNPDVSQRDASCLFR